ncbi:MAG: DUF4890 domain-containing protein [Prevotella sp.]|nr:DUF4890 domain-containing protein [Prevotella sp.]
MKRMILAVAALMVITLSAQAQDDGSQSQRQRPSKEEMAQRQTDMMADSLGLTDEQKEAVLALNTEYAGKQGPGMHRPGMRPQPKQDGTEGEAVDEQTTDRPQAPEARPEMNENPRAEYNEALKGILTEEQYAKYETMQKNMRPRGGRPGGPRGKGPRDEEGNGPSAPRGEQPAGCPCPANCPPPCEAE